MAPQELKYTTHMQHIQISMWYKVDNNYGISNICRACDHIDL